MTSMTLWKSVCVLAGLVGIVASGAWAQSPHSLSRRTSKEHPPVRPSASLPAPRWQYSAAWVGADKIVVTQDTVLLYREYDGKSVVALDRATGKELWRHSTPSASSRTSGSVEKWRQIFPVENNLLVVQVVRTETVPGAKEKSGYCTGQQFFVRGVDARNGNNRWQVSAERQDDLASTSQQLLGVYGGKIAAVDTGQKVTIVDAATGRSLIPGVKQDQEILRRVSAAIGEHFILFRKQSGRELWQLLNLETGEISPAPMLGGVEGTYISGRFVFRVDTDNDAPGGSQFPKWLETYDRQGKQVWRFPSKTTYSDANRIFAASESLLDFLLPLPAAHVVLTGMPRNLIALNARDGVVIWRKPLPSWGIEPKGNGFLLLDTPAAAGKPAHASLAFVHGRTGRVTWLGRFADSYPFKADGDDLILLGQDKVLRCYNSKEILRRIHP